MGKHLRTMVDTYGTCPYILVRVSERSGPGKLLVRGCHGLDPAKLEQALLSEVRPNLSCSSRKPSKCLLLVTSIPRWRVHSQLCKVALILSHASSSKSLH